MSVTTTFDEKLQQAKHSLKTVIECLMVCADEDTYGYSDIKSEYIDELHEVIAELVKIKRKL